MRWAWAPLQACEHQPDPNTRHTSSPQGCHDTTSRPAPTSSARSRPAGCRNGGGGGFRCRYLAAARRAPRQSCAHSLPGKGGNGQRSKKKSETKTRPWGNILSAMRCVALRVRSRLASRGGLRWVHTCAWAHERPCRAQHGQGELERVRSPAGSRVRARGEAFGGVSAQRSPRREA